MTMQCAEVQRFIDAYIDGEFADEDRAELDRHFEACESCRAEAVRQQKWKSLVRARLARPSAPYGLHARIERALDAETAPAPLWRRISWRVGPAVLVSAALAALILQVKEPPSSPLFQASILDHTRNLPVEVASPNPDEVANWFQGKVDFPVRPPRFGANAQLLGGRLERFGTHHAAYLVYNVDGRKVSVVVFDPNDLPFEAPQRVVVQNRQVYMVVERGYRVAAFRDQGVGYAVTTDFDEPRVVQMVRYSFR
jgi:anti-sigma factor (TIGR02949 family)